MLTKEFLSKKIKPVANGFLCIDLSRSQINSFKGLENAGDIAKISELLASENFIREIDKFVQNLKNLRVLNLSMNNISEISNLENIPFLEELNLSMNRITQIKNLWGLSKIKKLDLSMNSIVLLQNLDLPSLEELNLTGNKIEILENLERLVNLKRLIIPKNYLSDADNLLFMKTKTLEFIDLSYNRIPMSYLDKLVEIIKFLSSLKDIYLMGNELCINKYYKVKLADVKSLQRIDGFEIQGYLKKQITTAKNEQKLEDLIQKAKSEYYKRMDTERKLYNSMKDILLNQIQRMDHMYEAFQHDMEEDLKNFIFFATEINERKKRGELVDLDDRLLEVWRTRLKKAEEERKRATDAAIAKQEALQKDFLNAKLVTTKFSQKMYEIAMQKPELWREIKQKEFDQIIQEQEKLQMDQTQYQEKTEIHREFEEIQERVQKQFSSQIASKVLANQAIKLLEEKNNAALKIARLMQKQSLPARGELLNKELGLPSGNQNFIKDLEKMLDETVSEPVIQVKRSEKNQLHLLQKEDEKKDFNLSHLQDQLIDFNKKNMNQKNDPILQEFDNKFENIIKGVHDNLVNKKPENSQNVLVGGKSRRALKNTVPGSQQTEQKPEANIKESKVTNELQYEKNVNPGQINSNLKPQENPVAPLKKKKEKKCRQPS